MECGSLLPLFSAFGMDSPVAGGTLSVEKLKSGGKPHALQNASATFNVLSQKREPKLIS